MKQGDVVTWRGADRWHTGTVEEWQGTMIVRMANGRFFRLQDLEGSKSFQKIDGNGNQ